MLLHLAFVIAQVSDLGTRLASARTEANPVVDAVGFDPVTAFLLKTIVICLVLCAADALGRKGRETAAARLLGFGVGMGFLGALSNI